MKHLSSPTAPKRSLGLSAAIIFLGLAASGHLRGQTIEWASAFGSDFKTSTGDPLDDTFLFELGAFADSFSPAPTNYAEWSTHWRVFDAATYNASLGFFSATASMNPQGGSASPDGNPAFNFQGLQAYMWIRNNDLPAPGTEWFLAENPAWIFPTALDDCCNNAPPLQWQIESTLVTIPEPSASLLTLAAASLLLIRRRRP